MCNRSIKKEELMKMKNSRQEELGIYRASYSKPFLNDIEETPSSWTIENKEETKKD